MFGRLTVVPSIAVVVSTSFHCIHCPLYHCINIVSYHCTQCPLSIINCVSMGESSPHKVLLFLSSEMHQPGSEMPANSCCLCWKSSGFFLLSSKGTLRRGVEQVQPKPLDSINMAANANAVGTQIRPKRGRKRRGTHS